MKIRINKRSDTPIHLQLREQIIALISNGDLKIGQVVPSVRELERQLGIHRHTVSDVYKELVKERWLVRRRGGRLFVLERAGNSLVEDKVGNLDELVSRTIATAKDLGYSIEQLATALGERAAFRPDRLLLVIPEEPMGEVLRYEVRKVLAFAPAVCTISMLQRDPALACGAVLLTPDYLVDGLKCIPAKDRNFISLVYAPLEPFVDIVQNLPSPSIIGIVSVSPAGMATVNGVMAPAVGELHTWCEFLMELPENSQSNRATPVLRRYDSKSYRHNPGVRNFGAEKPASGRPQTRPDRAVAANADSQFPLATLEDLQAMDVLFCDSITYDAIKHPNKHVYRLLPEKALRAIIAAGASLRKGRPQTETRAAPAR